MLLLDEPTNHLDAESVAWLQHHLEAFPGCVILVTHDRYFLDQVTKWTLELDRGKGIPYEGNYSGWLEQKAKRTAQEASEEAGKKRTIDRELEWVRSSPSARRSRRPLLLFSLQKMVCQRLRRLIACMPFATSSVRRCAVCCRWPVTLLSRSVSCLRAVVRQPASTSLFWGPAMMSRGLASIRMLRRRSSFSAGWHR
jgi:energy-coupling factor transporter ATP-binding protein EcfA2